MTISFNMNVNVFRLVNETLKESFADTFNILANEIRKEWITNIAQSSAPSKWKSRYISTIRTEGSFPYIEILGGDDSFNNSGGIGASVLIEEGAKPFDMKIGLLNSPKAKVGKNGKKYITVPFRHGTPGTSGFNSVMPTSLYQKIKSMPFGSVLKTGKIEGQDLSQYGKKTHWKSGKFQGLTKVGREGHTGYYTFRRVSEDSSGWIYPGQPAHKIFPGIINIMNNQIKIHVTDALENFMKEMK